MAHGATRWLVGHDEGLALSADGPATLMGIVNVTPDSFSDGGVAFSPRDGHAAAIDHALRLAGEGASILDIGGESTRPGAEPVEPAQQIERVVPVIEGVRRAGCTLPISVDTTRSAVARAALDAGATIVNDVSAGTDDADMLALVAERGAALALMHRRLPPEADRYSNAYDTEPTFGAGRGPGGVIDAVIGFLRERVAAATQAGIDPVRLAIDPGFGFGKSVQQNIALMRAIPELSALGHAVLIGVSRKSFLGSIGGGVDDPTQRVPATLAASVLMRRAGGWLFRVHDVAAHRQALDAADAMLD